MKTVGDDLSSSYSSISSNNISHHITNYQVVDAINNDSVASVITLELFQSVTSEMSKTQVYLRKIMEHLSLPKDGSPTGNNSGNKSVVSFDTTGNFL